MNDIFYKEGPKRTKKIIEDESLFKIKKNSDEDLSNIKKTKNYLVDLREMVDESFLKESYRALYINLVSCIDYYTTEIIIYGLISIAKAKKKAGKSYKDLKISIQVLDSIELCFDNPDMKETVFELIKLGIRGEIYWKTYQKWDKIEKGLFYVFTSKELAEIKSEIKSFDSDFINNLNFFAEKRDVMVHSNDRILKVESSERNDLIIDDAKIELEKQINLVEKIIATIQEKLLKCLKENEATD